MRKMPRFVSLILAGTLLMGAAGSVFAWKDATNYTEFPEANCPHDSKLLADDGDVVTTEKWNSFACYTRNIWVTLFGLDAYNTPFFGLAQLLGNESTQVTEINLPIRNGATNEYGGVIHFKDPSLGYYGSAATSAGTWKWGILWRTNGTYSGTIQVQSPKGLVIWQWIGYPEYLVGWEKISTSTTGSGPDSAFVPECQYRVLYSGRYYYATTSGSDAIYWTDSGADYKIDRGTKTISQVYQSGTWSNHVMVEKIEKLCLPSYNPKGF